MMHNKPCSWASNNCNIIRHVALNLDTHQILGAQRQFVPAVYLQRQVLPSSSSTPSCFNQECTVGLPLYFFTVPFRITSPWSLLKRLFLERPKFFFQKQKRDFSSRREAFLDFGSEKRLGWLWLTALWLLFEGKLQPNLRKWRKPSDKMRS